MANLANYEQSQPIAARYFIQALQSHTLAHGYVLKGVNLPEMYSMALDIAKILNCSNRPSAIKACGVCQNCRWIEQNSHPAVNTISRLTYLVSDHGGDLSEEDLHRLAKKGTQQTQIKAEQISRLLGQLSVSSQYCRVILFVDAEELPASVPSAVVPPSEWRAMPGNEEKSFHLRPLERRLFNAASANRFLKTLEEPPPNTLFFFLTDSDESLLETIISRCQVLPFFHTVSEEANQLPEAYGSFFQQLQNELRQCRDFYPLVQRFQSFLVDQEGLSLQQGLSLFQRYLHQGFQHQELSPAAFKAYRQVQQHLEHAHKMLQAKTNAEQTMNHLFYQLSQT